MLVSPDAENPASAASFPMPGSIPPPSSTPRILGPLQALSPAMQRVLAVLERLAPTELTVTLIGETGTGKDVLAHALHDHSGRAQAPFVVFDCGAVAANLAESELFGHERGAFTGAHSAHAGAFERADGGTLFLDEVGELALDLQPRLLRALENRRVRRVGGNQYRSVDLRVVAATNRDLKSLVAAGRFREDLYFRLAAAVVAVPALRERTEDIPLLVRRLLEEAGSPGIAVSEACYASLRAHAWPGNVRELKNALACALAFVDAAGVLEPQHLQLLTPPPDSSSVERLPLGGQPLARIERAAIKQTLVYTRGNKVLAAQVLGIAVSTLYEKLKKYGL
ncbi:MAG TPA: sigma-54 dependent transcriptional regulator [Polyangiaceae bacterium]|nr:sigma-54 dependent transcriptional regulator [Polyangiaceae bacterium]